MEYKGLKSLVWLIDWTLDSNNCFVEEEYRMGRARFTPHKSYFEFGYVI